MKTQFNLSSLLLQFEIMKRRSHYEKHNKLNSAKFFANARGLRVFLKSALHRAKFNF